jgi:hypothetical protein
MEWWLARRCSLRTWSFCCQSELIVQVRIMKTLSASEIPTTTNYVPITDRFLLNLKRRTESPRKEKKKTFLRHGRFSEFYIAVAWRVSFHSMGILRFSCWKLLVSLYSIQWLSGELFGFDHIEFPLPDQSKEDDQSPKMIGMESISDGSVRQVWTFSWSIPFFLFWAWDDISGPDQWNIDLLGSEHFILDHWSDRMEWYATELIVDLEPSHLTRVLESVHFASVFPHWIKIYLAYFLCQTQVRMPEKLLMVWNQLLSVWNRDILSLGI